jgi:hypothetical protein
MAAVLEIVFLSYQGADEYLQERKIMKLSEGRERKTKKENKNTQKKRKRENEGEERESMRPGSVSKL